jgi:acetylglutamate synthase
MVKYKCVKMECPICHNAGSVQLFINKDGKLRYARTRHYSHLHKHSKKPQFTYCKIENLDMLKPQVEKQGIIISSCGQDGQGQKLNTHDLQLTILRRNLQTRGAGSSARIEHHPPK